MKNTNKAFEYAQLTVALDVLSFVGLIAASLFLTWAKAEPAQVAMPKHQPVGITTEYLQIDFEREDLSERSAESRIDVALRRAKLIENSFKVAPKRSQKKKAKLAQHAEPEFTIELKQL